ncbi:iron donor protein CyaY [Kwoniella bestiolae CBS 10118]|uniref:ferroxidase n=1 Tax=Kwoniella bestiolae CBS 10118 TaxID=1296100 RepID=A0A1B9FUZ8_9TREE|nr:iron donor protein CyaY [Kwoniella bestiolae CBS 10118]OCF22599.1 iron donor protein CyaY [Kwoniella bestiolae CBS 10118]
MASSSRVSHLLRGIRPIPHTSTVQPISKRSITSLSTRQRPIPSFLTQNTQLRSSPASSSSFTPILRGFTTSSRRQTEQGEKPASTLSPEEYEQVSERDMDILHENLEVYVEQFGQNDWEVEYSSGVMTLLLPPHGTYVINKQPPNLQIWMSSPVSGPSRFDYISSKGWVHHRDESIVFSKLLEGELREFLRKSGKETEAEEWDGTGL